MVGEGVPHGVVRQLPVETEQTKKYYEKVIRVIFSHQVTLADYFVRQFRTYVCPI